MRRARVAVVVLVAAAALTVFPAAASSRRHRLHLPSPQLPHSLAVDEKEWAVQPSKTTVGAGTVRFQAHNRGQDDHNFVIVDASWNVYGSVSLTPGASAEVVASLRPGTYRLFCSLFAGTPESHDARGMHAFVTVK
jgi:plastocyanin